MIEQWGYTLKSANTDPNSMEIPLDMPEGESNEMQIDDHIPDDPDM
jgi:hypothetical protein